MADGRAHIPRCKRIARYFLFPLRFILSNRNIRKVIAWQQFYGLMTSVYARLLHRHPEITILTFIYKPKRGIVGKAFRQLVKFAVSNPDVKRIIVFSPDEVEYYTTLFPKCTGKFIHLPLGLSEKRPLTLPTAPESQSLFSAGRSNRNYQILKEACEATATRLRIACPEESSEGFQYTEILTTCFDEKAEKEIDLAFAVAIPLHDNNISSGQLMALQAMRAAKPLIVSDHTSLRPYVIDKETALVCRSRTDWENALRTLRDNSSLRIQMGQKGHKLFLNHFTLSKLGNSIGNMV